jgi:hypothetical protein
MCKEVLAVGGKLGYEGALPYIALGEYGGK